jgi:hypothetical protein
MKSLLSVNYSDITYSVIAPLIWSMLEPALGIALACAPIIRPIFKIFREKSSRNGSNGPNSMDVLDVPTDDLKNFQRLQEEHYRLEPLGQNRLYSTKFVGGQVDDVESQKSSQSESELVPASSKTKIRVKSDWSVQEESVNRAV